MPPIPPSPGISIQSPPAGMTQHSHLVLLTGHITPAPPPGSSVTVTCPPHPPVHFPVHVSGRFKALAPLSPGENLISLTCGPASLDYAVAYDPLPPSLARPINLVIIAGRDSPLTYDDTRPTTYEDAVRKFRMAAYLWQAYTADQMLAQGFGPRTFQFEEERGVDTTTRAGVVGSIAKVTLVRSRRTVAEIRGESTGVAHVGGLLGKLSIGKDRKDRDKGKKQDPQELYALAREAIAESPEFRHRLKGLRVSALLIDSTRSRTDPTKILGHAALGGSGDPFPLGIFGSHTTFSWPSSLEDVVGCFTNPTPVDTRYVGIDCEGKNYGMAANVGMGAFMHETGHMLGCPHQTRGVMLRDYVRLHKSFIAEDADSMKECAWHPLDAIRFASHPSFSIPQDAAYPPKPGPIVVSATEDTVSVFAPSSNLMAVELRKPGKETASPYIDLHGSRVGSYTLNRSVLCGIEKITILASDGGKIDDFSVGHIFAPPGSGLVRSQPFGRCGALQFIPVPPNLSAIRVYGSGKVDGVELYPGNILLGTRAGPPIDFALAPDEKVIGINVRHGWWIDALQFVTTRRVSPWMGKSDGGGYGESRVPKGYVWRGVFGTVDGWVRGLGFDFAPEFGAAEKEKEKERAQQHFSARGVEKSEGDRDRDGVSGAPVGVMYW